MVIWEPGGGIDTADIVKGRKFLWMALIPGTGDA